MFVYSVRTPPSQGGKTSSILVHAANLTPIMSPFQIIFTPTAAAELGKLPKDLQLEILGEFRGLPQDVRSDEMDKFGRLNRDGHHMFRFRLGDYRVYFERHELGVLIHRILHAKKHLRDFLYRNKLPGSEDQVLEENPEFWKLIEKAKSSAC